MAAPVKLGLAIALVAATVGCDRSTDAAPHGVTTAASGAASAAPVVQAVITVDDAHDLMKGGVGYSIAPATELVLDVGARRFEVPGGGKGPVDTVHVAHGPSEYYRASLTPGARIALNARALDPVKGGAFAGFVPGEPYLVAVGREEPSPDGVMHFAPAWTSTVTVTPR